MGDIKHIITGSSEKDFLRWLGKHEIYGYSVICEKLSGGFGDVFGSDATIDDLFYSIPEYLQLCIIQEWLDSVGLVISIDPFSLSGEIKTDGSFSGTINLKVKEPTSRVCLVTREQALRFQIRQADIIYNEKHSKPIQTPSQTQ